MNYGNAKPEKSTFNALRRLSKVLLFDELSWPSKIKTIDKIQMLKPKLSFCLKAQYLICSLSCLTLSHSEL